MQTKHVSNLRTIQSLKVLKKDSEEMVANRTSTDRETEEESTIYANACKALWTPLQHGGLHSYGKWLEHTKTAILSISTQQLDKKTKKIVKDKPW